MLEGLAAWILRTYVGEYVENLNTDQLSIGVGTVDLRNLPLKKTALRGLDLPLTVKSGFIGHLQLSIPLTRPKSEPWIIRINKLYLVAGPQQFNEYNEEEEKTNAWNRKKRQLDLFEAQWKESQDQQDQSGGFWSYSWWPSLYSSFSTSIVENLQLCITDVHIRYENATMEKTPFAVGITIAKISVQSTNENWDAEDVIQNERNIKFKLMDLQSLAVYWDNDVTLVGDLPSSELDNALKKMINRSEGTVGFCKHQYILEAITAQAKVQRNASALPLKNKKPRFVVDVHIESIPFSLAEFQYRTLTKLIGEFERSFRQSHYRKWRPNVPVKNNAKLWWQFSFNCILNIIQKRNKTYSKDFLLNRAHDNLVYVDDYTQHLTNKVITEEVKASLERIERDLTFEELVILRKVAMSKAEKVLELLKVSDIGNQGASNPAVPQGTASQGWLSGWYSWYWQDTQTSGDNQDGRNTIPEFTAPATKEEEEFLDELSGPGGTGNQSIFNRDKVFAHLNFHLGTGCFKLLKAKETKDNHIKQSAVVELEFSNASWESEVRPQSSTWEFKMSLGAIHVRDKVTKGSLFPALVAPQGKKYIKPPIPSTKASVGALAMSATTFGLNIIQELSEPPVFEMRFVQLAPHSKVPYKFTLTTEPLDITYNPRVIDYVSDFFSKDTLNANYMNVERQLKEAAWLRYEELKNQTKAELRHTLDSMMEGVEMKNLKRWDVQLDISAPRIFIPESFKDRKASVVLVDFGHLSFKNLEAIQRGHRISESEDTDAEDDSFVTPLSTPPSEVEEEQCSPNLAMKLADGLTIDAMKGIIYDRYVLVLSEIQMIVCSARDVSKDIGQTDLHVVNKFTISLSLDRRLMFTADPMYPALCLSGNLPSLVFHINEHKCHALTKCINQFTGQNTKKSSLGSDTQFATSTPKRSSAVSTEDIDNAGDELYYSMYSSQVTLEDSPLHTRRSSKAYIESAVASKTKELMEESKMLLFQFNINELSCGIHSRGHLIAELQVYDVSLEFLQRPYDTSTSLKVHGVHLVDAVQSYGPEYELLLSSSQRNWCTSSPPPRKEGTEYYQEAVVIEEFGQKRKELKQYDKKSGNNRSAALKMSGFASESDGNGNVLLSCGTEKGKHKCKKHRTAGILAISKPCGVVVSSKELFGSESKSQVYAHLHELFAKEEMCGIDEPTFTEAVSTAFSAVAGFVKTGRKTLLGLGESMESNDTTISDNSDDLISFEYLVTSEERPSAEKAMRLATLQFNSLNCIANQDTLAILMQFFSAVFASDKDKTQSSLPTVQEEQATPVKITPEQEKPAQPPLEISASFRSMNILLIRGVKVNNVKTVRKVAEVTVNEFQINASFLEGQSFSGSLGGLRIMDLTPEGSLHPCVLTCGTILEETVISDDDPYRLRNLPTDNDYSPADSRAFRFSFMRPTGDHHRPNVLFRPLKNTENEITEIGRNVQISIHMASVQYTHTQRFLSELMLCGGDFAESAREVGESLKQAASSVAMGLVSKKKALVDELDYLSSSFIAPSQNVDIQDHRRRSILSEDGMTSDFLLEDQDQEDGVLPRPNQRVYVSIEIEAPVVHFPRSSSSLDVLVANLGEITIRNTHMLQIVEGPDGCVEYDTDRVQLDIKDVSVFSITLSSDDLSRNASGHSSFIRGSPSKIPQTGIHILYKTGLQVCVDRQSEQQDVLNTSKPTICIDARILTPLKLELSTYTYKQLLETVDNLSGEKGAKIPQPAGASTLTSPIALTPDRSPASSFSSFETLVDEKSVPRRVTFETPITENQLDKPIEWDQTMDDEKTPVKATVHVPHFSIKLCGELRGIEHDFVDIMFREFYMNFISISPTVTEFDVYLGGLLVKDLMQEPDSTYSYLMSSSHPSSSQSRPFTRSTSMLSTSCPTVSECGLNSNLSSSLPSYFQDYHGIPVRVSSPLRPLKYGKAPSLSAVSMIEEDEDDSMSESVHEHEEQGQKLKDNALVTLHVTLVSKDDEEFVTKHESVDRRIKIDFNSLDTVVNLQTWVLVLDFFGIGVPQNNPPQPSSPVSTQAPTPLDSVTPQNLNRLDLTPEEEEPSRTHVEFQVHSLTLTLNKAQYPLAKAKVAGLDCYIKMADGHLSADGKLTTVSLTDMSPHGSLYREKFTTCGDEALRFNYLKYDDPDPLLLRENDMSLSLHMSSVQYVHTKRFITELIAFCQHFLQLQEVLGRMRAQSAGNEVSWMFGRSSRVSLNIKAGNPVIVIPQSSKSPHMLVADLGDLTITNAFLWEESEGTILHPSARNRSLSDTSKSKEHEKCLLDCMTVDLRDMDLFTAVRIPATVQQTTSKFSFAQQGVKLLKEKCRLNLQVERNLDWSLSKAVSDFLCSGELSSVCASIDYSQYCLILGLLGENFGEVLETFETPSSYLQDPLGKPPEFEEVWTTLKMTISLVNVSVELFPVQLFEHPEQQQDQPLPSLAKIDFIKTMFEFETFSDWSQTIDLVSTEVIFEDTRDMNDSEPCVFKDVLVPKSHDTDHDENALQFEVHYRDTPKRTLLTCLFNHSRIVLIIDYLLDTYNFIMRQMFQNDEPSKVDQSVEEDDDLSMYSPAPPAESGVVTKCEVQNQPDQNQKTFEMKVNISGTEFVLLENLGTRDTSAVVLKLTSVLAWRPHLHTQKWLSCSIQSLEMFSCIFSCEEETAQSIIDPTAALIELNNAKRQVRRKTAGLLDITTEQLPSVEINLHSSLNMRISYTDYKLYLTIIESVTKQLNKAMKADNTTQQHAIQHDFDEKVVKRLVDLGFHEEDCIKALQATSGRLEASATWLLENATPVQNTPTDKNSGWQFAGFEVRAGTMCVCLIDDCGDTDVPLIEISIQNFYFWHDLQATGDGAAHCSLVVEYYNRNVSGWEPFIEPWRCQLHWQQQYQTKTSPSRLLVKLDAPDRLDITITSMLINMIKQTLSSWTEDLYGKPERTKSNDGRSSIEIANDSSESLESPGHRPESSMSLASCGSGPHRKRAPFVPYAIKNNTGCPLVFRTISTTPSRVIITSSGIKLTAHDNDPDKMSDWREVQASHEETFEFSSRDKMRHKDTHDFIVHQIVVKVDNWAQVSPVSVDRVGTFFRYMRPDSSTVSSVASDIQPVRIVFNITLEGGARKVVTVQSALTIQNKMDLPLEIKLQGHTSYQGSFTLPIVHPLQSLTVPLHAVSWNIYARPHGVGVGFSSESIEWKGVTKAFTTEGFAKECHPIGNGSKFRFCVAVQREGYPEDDPMSDMVPSKKLKVSPQPAHCITILAPLVLVNLLPCDLTYNVKKSDLRGNIKAGRSVPLYLADPEQNLDLAFAVENFENCDTVRVIKRSQMVEQTIMHVELRDTKGRSLVLNLLISAKPGGALRLSLYAPYWMINNTGIPLIFKREGTYQEIAGQFDEHEMARSLTPLLFSFYDRDPPLRCQMRIGNAFHEGSGKPVWCSPFSLDNPREFNRVHARQANGRPDKKAKHSAASRRVQVNIQGSCGYRLSRRSREPVRIITAKQWVYDIGIDVRLGRGRYQLTRIVTFATRYQLENKTPHTMAFNQRHFVRDQGTTNPEGTLTALPGALVLFHWARTDLDQLLCIRLNDVYHCQWSGGFRIDRDDSFHVNMRSLDGCSLFVRVEIMLKGATFHVVLSDASQLPPPYRIDNLSEVPVRLFQTGTEDRFKTILQPKQSVPYSWDEPTLPPELSLGVVDGASYSRYFMNILGSGERIYYYNPVYIVFTHTFSSSSGYNCGRLHLRPADQERGPSIDMRELVLDVPQGTAVLLRRKEPLKRSQLWRMTGSGLLRHEGSSPITDPRKPPSSNAGLVLDIDSLAPPTCGKYVRLVLSKPNTRRKHSQTWSFTEDGRMKCDLPGLFVQSRNGINGLRDGADAVLGPANITKEEHVPIEQCIMTTKMRPGSGCVAVKVKADGPTRVLHISDSLHQFEESEKDWLLVERKGGMRQPAVMNLDQEPSTSELELQVRLAGGLGVSVINTVPEELVYGTLDQIEIDYVRNSKRETLEVSIGRLQVDNQLFSSPLPVLMYPTLVEKGSKEETTLAQIPTLHLSAFKEHSFMQNVEIYKNLDLTLRNMTLHVEERLLLKLLQFFGYVKQDDDVASTIEEDDESLYSNQRAVSVSTSSSKKYYFERIQFNSMQLKVSVASAGRLPEDLQQLKHSLGLILFNLEDATLGLETFSRHHPFESFNTLMDSMSKHYYEELRNQAAAIVGSVDFLGNPMGLLNDVSSGLEGLVKRGNVGGLFLNVAHGVSDSAAKITGSLSDGLWSASMDTKFQESREAMRPERFGSSRDHFVAGVKGLGMGLVGGLTSMVTQPIEGAHNSGLSGFIAGIGKGIVGTVAKPTAGVLDFASGTAAAVRGQATRSSRYFPPKQARLRRNCFGPSGAIPKYSSTHAEGQEIMLKLNENNFGERFVLSESVRRDKEERLKAIITTEGVYFVRAKGTPSPESIVLLVRYAELFECQPLYGESKDYIELVMNADNSSVPTPSKNPSKRPRVRCDDMKIAQKVAQKINYSKNLYDEVKQTVIPEPKETISPTSYSFDKD